MSELEVLASLLGSISWWPASSSSQAQWHARPQGPLLWFHALTLGETAVVLPVVFRCLLEYNEHVHVLLTTKSAEAISLLSTSLPARVIVQDVPLDNYFSMRRFLSHFQPQACILMESPAWPVLVQCCAARGIRLGLLNARMSSRAFLSWFQPRVSRGLLRRMLGHFSLVVPQSDIDVGRFRIFGATLQQMPGWCSDLKYAAALGNSVWHLWRPKPSRIASLRTALCGRPLWVAAHTQPGEEEAVATVHGTVAKDWQSLLTVLAPAASGRCAEVAEMLETIHSLKVVVWSSVVDAVAPQAHKQQQPQPQQQRQQHTSRGSSWLLGWGGSSSSSGSGGSSSRDAEGQHRQQHGQAGGAAAAAAAGSSGRGGAVEDPAMLLKGVDVLLLDLQADLPLMYSVSEVAFIGSSLLEGCSGHNLAEAAVAGCAVLVGEHAGHFSTMADELNQAAIVAAEEASAAVNSSGPMEDPFFAAAAAAADTRAGSSSGPAAAGTSGAGAAGPSSSAAAASGEHAVVEGAESEEPSPRDGSHWRGVLNYTQQHEDEQELHGQQHYHDSSSGGGGGVRDHGSSGFSSLLQLQQQQQQHHQHQQLHTLLQQQQSSPRPSSAPAAVWSAGGAPISSGGRALAAPAATPESSDGGAYNPVEARNTAALLYRRHARTGSSANSSRVNSPVASLRPSTAGGSAYGQQQQQQALPPQQPQSQQWPDSGSYLQQYQQQQQQQGPGPSPLSQQSSSTNQQAPSLQQQQPQRQPHSAAADCSTGGGSTFQEGAGPFPRYPAAADLPVPQAPPPSAATNTPVNGPTGNVTPVTPAGSFGGADPAHLQHPDSRDLALRLAQQQQQQGAATSPQRESDPSTAPLQPQGGKQQQQQQAVGGSGCASHQQQQQQRARTDDSCLQLQLQHGANYNSSSGGGGVSNAGSTPLSSVADLYSMPFASSSSPRGLNLPHTPHPTPEDSAHTMGGRSPMLSGAGVSYTPPNLAGLVALQTPTEPLTSLPSLEPSWQSAASSNGSNGGICCAGGGATDSSRSSTAPPRSSLGNGSSSGGGGGQQQQSWPPTQDAAGDSFSDHSHQDASYLQRPGCPTPPEGPCFSRASAASTVSTNLPVTFSNGSSSSSANGRSSSSRSRLGRAISSGGWAEEQQRQQHRRHLQGVVNRVWRGGSEGGSPMVAALAESAAAGELSSSEDESDGDGGEPPGVDGRSSGRRMGSSDAPVTYPARPDSPPSQAAAGAAGTAAAPGGVDAALPVAAEAAAAAAAADGAPSEEEGVLAVSLTGTSSGCGCGRLSEESSGLLFEGEASEGEGESLDRRGGRAGAGGVAEEGEECGGPFSRSPIFAELAACHSSSSITDGNGSTAAAAGGGGGGKQGAVQLAAAGGAAAAVVSASISGGSVSAKQGPQTSSNGCSSSSRSSSQEQEDLYTPNLCPMERQLQLQQQQQQARSASDQGSVGWEDWGQAQQHAQDDSSSNNGAVAASTAAAAAAAAAAPMRSSDGGGAAAAGASRLGDPRRSRHFLDVPSESSPAAEDMEIQPVAGQQQQQQGLGAGAQQQQQRQPLSGSGSGGASVLPVRHLNGQVQPAAAAAAGSSAGASSLGGVYSSSSGGGGGGVWLDPTHSGAATPTRSRAYHQAYQYHHSASSTPSAGVTPRGTRGQQQPARAGSSHQGYHHHQQQHQYYNHHHHQQQQLSGRRSVDLQQQQHFGQHMHHHQHLDGSSGGGSGAGMFSPLARLVGGGDSSSYWRAESVTSMTSFATSAGGDRDLLLLHDDQPGSSRMSLLGEHSHGSTHLGGYSTTGGGRFTGGPGFASTGRFSECATPRSMATDVFRGHSEPQGGAPSGGGGGGDAGGLLSPGTSYLRYRGEYILPATHLPSAPQGPAVWRVSGTSGLSLALNSLLQEPLERRSRGHAAAQAAAKLASGLVSTVWHVVDDMVVTPALQEFVAQGGLSGDAAAQHAARAPRIPGHPRH